MGDKSNKLVPWGRTLDEYKLMFQLSEQDLNSKILGCADGPASFNSEMHQLGRKVVSVDPIYAQTKDQLQTRISEVHGKIVGYCNAHMDQFTWSYFKNPNDLERHRVEAMTKFLQDFDAGVQERRYVAASLPSIDFTDQKFDLALCSHLLFLYSYQFSIEFHLQSIRELCRVAREVRIFPLVEMYSEKSAFLKPVMRRLKKEGFSAEVVKVPYEFLRNGNKMLVISKSSRPKSRIRRFLGF